MNAYITVPEAAKRLGITRQAVHKLVQLGRLHADKIGRDWLIIPEPALIPEAAIASPGNGIRKRRPRRLGFSLVEVALSLGIAGLALVSMEQGADDANRQIKDAAAADRITQVYDAAEQYLQANPGLAGTMTVGTPVQLAVGRTSSTGAIPAPSLQSLGFLPANYIDSNPYGQTHLVVLRAEANNVVEALVQTVGGTTIPDVDLGRISAKVGANGGVVDSTPPPGIAAGTMQGTGGGWSEAATDWTAGSVTPSAGHALAVNYVTQTNILQPWLYRNVVAGQPEANRMHTNIDMTHNALNAVATIDNTDQTSGAVGVISVGSTLEGTTNTPVKFNNGLMACAGNATGCAVRVSDDGEFVDNNDGWITYEGSGAVAGTGLLLAGAGDNLQVNGATTMQGVATANGGLIAQQYIQSYGNVELMRTASNLAALDWPNASGNWNGGSYLRPDTSTATANLLHLYGGSLTVDGNLAAGNSVTSYDMFSRIYYDSSNSAYYMEPAGNSNLNAVYANLIDDSGQLIGGGGAFNVYQSGGAWYLYMGGQINATGSIGAGGNVSATDNVIAGQAVDAGTSITASNGNITASNGSVTAAATVTGGTGVVTLAAATAGTACATAGEIAQDTSGHGIDSCTSGVWSDSTQFSHEAVFSDNPNGLTSGSSIAFYTAAHANPGTSPMFCHSDAQNLNPNFAVRDEAFSGGAETGNTVGVEDTTVPFFVQPGQSFLIYESANWDGDTTNGGFTDFGTGISTFCWY